MGLRMDLFLKIMLAVFAVHFLVFTGLWWRRRRLPLALAAGAFLLLEVALLIRLRLPESYILGIHSYWFARIPAWGLAISGIICSRRQRRK